MRPVRNSLQTVRSARLPAMAIAMLAGCAIWSAASAQAEIPFHDSLESARATSRTPQKIAVYFRAPWCGWCRRMEAEVLNDPRVKAAAAGYSWVRVDLENAAPLASRYRVRGTPVVLILNDEDEVTASRSGALSAEELVAFLTPRSTEPEPTGNVPSSVERLPQERLPADIPESLPDGEALVAALQDGDEEVIVAAVRQLARADRAQRRRVLDAFQAAGQPTWPVLARLLGDETLALRAAAALALERSAGAELPFHAFAAPEQRSRQQEVWQAWLRTHGIEPARAPASAPAEAEIPDEAPPEELRKQAR